MIQFDQTKVLKSIKRSIFNDILSVKYAEISIYHYQIIILFLSCSYRL